MSRKIIPGKRYFRCECGNRWVSHSRDMMSPSGEECSKCDEWVSPHSFRQEQVMKMRPVEKIGLPGSSTPPDLN